MVTTNALNIRQAGVVSFDGVTDFTGSVLTQHNVLVGGTANSILGVAPSTSGNLLTSNGTDWVSLAPATSGTVTNVSGTVNRITVTNPTTTPVIDIAATYVGQTSITTLGTIGTGVWQGTAIGVAFGGTGHSTTAASTGTILRADGTFWSASTATFADTYTASNILYSNGANTVTGLATANNGVLVTSNTGVPSILAGPGVTGKVLQSNAAAAPSYSTATYPSVATSTGSILRADGTNWVATTATYPNTTTINQLLYSSAANTIAGVTAANSATLVSSSAGVPTWSSSMTNGQVILGSSGATPTAGTIGSSDSSITWTLGAGTLTGQVTGGTTVLKTLTGNTGGALSPTAGNINITGTGSITVAGAGSTLTPQLTGLTNHAIQIGAGTATLTQLAATATTGQVLQNNSGADPTYSTATYPSTTTANQILFSSATNVVGGDADLTYTASTDTLATSNAQLKGPKPWSDVTAFGADPTGVADSTTAFTNAIAQHGSLGGIVWVPAGTYKITTTITITTPHIRIVGASRTDSVINWAGSTTADLFVFNQWYCACENITLTTSSNTQTAGSAINMAAGTNYSYLWRTNITNFWSGVNMQSHLSYVEDCEFRTFSNAAANGYWVQLTGSFDRWILKLTADNGSNLAGFAGIKIVQTASLMVDNCNLVRGTSCMSIEPTVGLTVPSVEVTNTFFDNSTNALSVSGAGTPARCKFTNCWFSSSTANGVLFNNANTQGFTFDNCDFYGNTTAGINATAVREWACMNSRIAQNGTGVLTTAGANHFFQLIGNYIGPTGVFTANGLGINVQAGTYAGYMIENNAGLAANTTPGITDSGSVTGQSQKIITDNTGAMLEGQLSATTSTSGAINTTLTAIGGGVNVCPIPAGSVQIGQTFRATCVGTCTSTVANVSTFRVHFGTAGTTADTAIFTAAVTSTTTGTNNGFVATLVFTVRTIGAAGTIAGMLHLANNGAAGVSANQSAAVAATAAAGNYNQANYLTVSYQSAAVTTTSTFTNVIIEAL